MEEVYKNIAEKIPFMSRSQEKIAKYILSNTNKTPFLTIEKLAELSDVSIATVTRFVIFLGYKGYPEFLKDAQESIQQQVNKNDSIKVEFETNDKIEDDIYNIFKNDLNNIKTTIGDLNIYELQKAEKLLINAKRIYIVARRSSSILGMYIKYYLDLMFDRVNLIESIEQIPKNINILSSEDVIIGVNFGKNVLSTTEIFTYLKKKGAATISITDNILSPLVSYSDVSLMAVTKGPDAIESLVAPLTLINALIANIQKEKKECFNKNLELLDEAWNKFDLYI